MVEGGTVVVVGGSVDVKGIVEVLMCVDLVEAEVDEDGEHAARTIAMTKIVRARHFLRNRKARSSLTV